MIVDIASARIKADAGTAVAAQRADTAPDVAVGDWDIMLRAVKLRLHSSAEPAPATEPHPQSALDLMRSEVLECVAAIDQLHATISHHIDRGHALEGAVAAAHVALAEVRCELASSHAEERAARRMAAHDDLTELPNGAGFRARLAAVAQAATRGQAFAVLYIDLDGFKAVNDAHGHATGDHLLRIIAARLAGEMRADGMTAERLLEHADTAMVRAKRQRSGHAFYDRH